MTDEKELKWNLPRLFHLKYAVPTMCQYWLGDPQVMTPSQLKAILAAIPDDNLPSLGVVRKGAYDNWQQVVDWAAKERDEAQAENKHLREKLAAAERELQRCIDAIADALPISDEGEVLGEQPVTPMAQSNEAPREVWVDIYDRDVEFDPLGCAWLSEEAAQSNAGTERHVRYIRADLAEQTTGKGSGDAAHRETAGAVATVPLELASSPDPKPSLGGSALAAADEAERRVLLRVAEACERAWLIRLADELRGMVGK